jgi:hypothetical protein
MKRALKVSSGDLVFRLLLQLHIYETDTVDIANCANAVNIVRAESMT